jgi:hypothetical protein
MEINRERRRIVHLDFLLDCFNFKLLLVQSALRGLTFIKTLLQFVLNRASLLLLLLTLRFLLPLLPRDTLRIEVVILFLGLGATLIQGLDLRNVLVDSQNRRHRPCHSHVKVLLVVLHSSVRFHYCWLLYSAFVSVLIENFLIQMSNRHEINDENG